MENETLGISEGDICNHDGCTGKMIYTTYGDCSCHINAPCNSCTSSLLVCDKCGYEYEN